MPVYLGILFIFFDMPVHHVDIESDLIRGSDKIMKNINECVDALIESEFDRLDLLIKGEFNNL